MKYLVPASTMLVPAELARQLLVVLKPGRQKYRDSTPDRLAEWFRDLEQLAAMPAGTPPPAKPVKRITAAQAALIIGISSRQVTTLAPGLGGRMVAGRWMLDAAAVADEAECRAEL